MDVYSAYAEKFSESKKLYEKSREFFPGGVSHDIRNYPPFPVVTSRCNDIYMCDTQGNKLIDLWMGHYANILGHGSKSQLKGIKRATEAGIHHGTLNVYQIEYAELLAQAVPEMESFRICTSGTEATMYVTRVARAYTRRHTIVKVEGGWHGGNSVLSTGVIPPFNMVSGLPEGLKTVSIPYNDTQKARELLNSIRDDIAAIILEPMLGSGGGIIASGDFLLMLREFCDNTGALLIFDEVITGFRFRYGSIWPMLGVCPDLFTFGKAAAGGMHIGIYGGRKDIMDTITGEKLFVGGGTYACNPLSMCVGIETLKTLKDMDYTGLNKAGDTFRNDLTQMTGELAFPAYVTGFGSFFCVHFLDRKLKSVTPAAVMANSVKKRDELFKAAMLVNDVFTMHAGGAFSFKHLEPQTINSLKEAYSASFALLS